MCFLLRTSQQPWFLPGGLNGANYSVQVLLDKNTGNVFDLASSITSETKLGQV
jgi:hypothetical protein